MSVASSGPPLQQRRRFAYRKPSDHDPTKLRDPSKEKKTARSETERIVADPTMKTFVEIWDRKLVKTIENMRLGDFVDDVKQDIYLFMCKKNDRGQTGLEAYDPSKGAFSSYVYHLVILKGLNYRNKLARDRLDLTETEFDLDVASSRSGEVHRHAGERADFWLQLERIVAELDGFAEGGFFDDDGRLITRDPRTVLELLLQGHSRQELARLLRCKAEGVDRLMARLRSCDELRELLVHPNDDVARAVDHEFPIDRLISRDRSCIDDPIAIDATETEMPRGYPGSGKAAKKVANGEKPERRKGKKPGPQKGWKKHAAAAVNGANGHAAPGGTAKEQAVAAFSELARVAKVYRDLVVPWGISAVAEDAEDIFARLASTTGVVARIPDGFKPLSLEQAALVGNAIRFKPDFAIIYEDEIFKQDELVVQSIKNDMARFDTPMGVLMLPVSHVELATA